MKLSKLFSKLHLPTRKTKLFVGLIVATAGAPGTVVFAGWSPNRPVFDYNNTADRVGSLTGPVFNSFINTPFYGDERAFFDASRTDQASQPNAFKDVLAYPTQGSKEVILRT